MSLLEGRSGLSEAAFARQIGLNVVTYRNVMGRSGTARGMDGPSLRLVSSILEALPDVDARWLLTGAEPPGRPAVADRPSPAVQALLDKVCQVLETEPSHWARSLASNVESFWAGARGDGLLKKNSTCLPEAETAQQAAPARATAGAK